MWRRDPVQRIDKLLACAFDCSYYVRLRFRSGLQQNACELGGNSRNALSEGAHDG